MVAAWRLRLLFATLLLFGSEILLWNNPVERPLLDWVAVILGYIALSATLLDFITRYKVRDLMGVMTLAGLYGLLNALILNPQTTLFDLPRTLITRVTGAHTLLGLEMLLLLLVWIIPTRQQHKLMTLLGAGIVGLAWGTWARYAPDNTLLGFEPAAQSVVFGIAGGVLLLILAQIVLLYRTTTPDEPLSLVLTQREAGLVGITFAGLLLLQLINARFDFTALFLIAVLSALCYAMLWFRAGTKHPPLFPHPLHLTPIPMLWILGAIEILLISGSFAYDLPLLGNTDFNQLTFVVYGFTLYGIAWLPTVSLMIGARAYIRQIQAKPL